MLSDTTQDNNDPMQVASDPMQVNDLTQLASDLMQVNDPMQASPDPVQVTSDDNLGADNISSKGMFFCFGQASKVPLFLNFQTAVVEANVDTCDGSYTASSPDPVSATYGCVKISDEFGKATLVITIHLLLNVHLAGQISESSC